MTTIHIGLCLLLGAGLQVFAGGATTRPGLELMLSQPGLNAVGKVAIDQLAKDIAGQHIDDQHGKTHAAGGKVDYTLKNMAIRGFTKPSFHVTLNPGAGITLAASGAGIKVHGDFRYKYRKHFIHWSDHGSFDVSASGVSFSISVKMGIDKTGRPTIVTTGCSSHVDKVKVKFHGGASWLYNLFDSMVAKSLKSNLQKIMCSAATKGVNVDAAKQLAKVEVITNLGKDMILDYRLTQAPVFTKNYIQTMFKGQISWKNDSKPYPSEPAAFPAMTQSSRMIYIMASEYVVNSYANAAFTHGLVRYNLSAESMPKGDAGFLNTTCSGSMCLGNFLYKVAQKYPNSSIMIQMETARAPFIRVSPKGINLTFNGQMIFRAKTPQAKVVYLFSMELAVNMSVRAWLDDHTVRADVSAFKPKVKVTDSKVGNISDVNLQYVFKAASQKFIIKKLKSLGQKGVDIPNMKNVKYMKPTLQLNEGSLMFATDLMWAPKQEIKTFRSSFNALDRQSL